MDRHELNNIVQQINGYAELLGQGCVICNDKEHCERFEDIRQILEGCRRLTEFMRKEQRKTVLSDNTDDIIIGMDED